MKHEHGNPGGVPVASAGHVDTLPSLDRVAPTPTLHAKPHMPRIFGYFVGAVWLVFSLLAFRNSASGWSDGHSDLGFWWAVIAILLAVAAGVALTGTARHRTHGPRK
jgi:hypothetical protein